mgnify:CR=1 FL=1
MLYETTFYSNNAHPILSSKNAIRDVVRWGVDMVTTDYPPRAVEVIEDVFGSRTADSEEDIETISEAVTIKIQNSSH